MAAKGRRLSNASCGSEGGTLGRAGQNILKPATPNGRRPGAGAALLPPEAGRVDDAALAAALQDVDQFPISGPSGNAAAALAAVAAQEPTPSSSSTQAPSPAPASTSTTPTTVSPGPTVPRRRNFGRVRNLTVDCTTKLIGDKIHKEEEKKTSVQAKCKSKQHPAQAVQTPGAVLSVWGSATNDQDHFAPYFAQKQFNFDGELRKMSHRVGVMSHRGRKPDYPNQDDFFVLARRESLLFGVMDGHGPCGHDVSHFVQEMLPQRLVERLREGSQAWHDAVASSFQDMVAHLRMDLTEKSETSGTTVSIAMLDRPEEMGLMRLRGAYLGDSVVVHGKRASKQDDWEVTTLVDIHRPNRPDELDRIVAAGGAVSEPEPGGIPAKLVTPDWCLAMSRAAGDFHATQYGLSSQPEMMPEVIFEEDYEHIILCCSDGIWDVLSPIHAVNFVGRYPPEEAQVAVERLVGKAQRYWQEMDYVVDDITAIAIWPGFDDSA